MNRYVHTSDYETSQLDDEWVVLNTDSFMITKLNEVGGFCWSLLHEPKSVQVIVAKIKENYILDNEEVEVEDIEKFLNQLIDYGLVKHAK
ncbi:PqqD family protein [Pseudalkalibacillus caeni]|uniref:PqqD family protein n=1 Tax=Exobacillus caeni TaxID=2574798 RepID=A0A5R9EXH0_9BACL|nr:PqqD family protein [Pseudalkalibacillus caeni]TLS35561.1 PqqD family protein [Pseudalkalibacillus caeni]